MNNQIKKEFKDWEEGYFNKPLIDLSKYFTTKDKKIINKLQIKIEDKVYTEYEFECLEMDLIAYYNRKEEIKQLDIDYNNVEKLWNICDKIRYDYKI